MQTSECGKFIRAQFKQLAVIAREVNIAFGQGEQARAVVSDPALRRSQMHERMALVKIEDNGSSVKYGIKLETHTDSVATAGCPN